MSGLHFDAATHAYTLGGQRLPSVTQVLAPLYDFSRVRDDVLEAKRALGQAVHLACQLDDEGDLDESSLDEAVRPYLDGYRLFKSHKITRVVAAELRVHHPTLRYAGTLDLLADIDGDRTLIDLKTPVVINPAVGLQTAAYVSALPLELLTRPSGGMHVRRAALRLTEDGHYRLIEYRDPNDFPTFVAMLTVHRWKEKHA